MDRYSSDRRGQVEGSVAGLSPNALVAAAIVVAALYFGRDVFVPFVVAVILSFVLAVPARLLQGWGLGHRLPVAIVVLAAAVLIAAIAFLVATQLADVASNLPVYQSTIREKLAALKNATAGSGPLERIAGMVQTLADDLAGNPPAPAGLGEAGPGRPIPVEIAATRVSPLQTIAGYVSPLLHPVATAALVAVFVVFILLQRGDLRNRAIRLAGSHDLQRTTAAMNDAAKRLSRLFLTQVLLNAAFGVVVAAGLWLIGIPGAILWGIMAALSRFVPYVGVALAAGGPLLLAAAVDPHWSMLLSTALFFAVLEFTVGHFVEPTLFGHSTGLSPIAVVASVTFWTWLWGPIGLLLATPLTVCLVVLGRHVERLEFLDVMFGDRPPLTVAESFYQRMLAGDAGEAVENAEVFLREHALATYYDEVAIKGLALAQVDLARGALDEPRMRRLGETMAELIEELAEHEDAVPEHGPASAEPKRAAGDADLDSSLERSDGEAGALPVLAPGRLPPGWENGAPVLCLAGRHGLDETGAAILAQLLGKHGLPAAVAGAETLASAGRSGPSGGGRDAVRIVCLSYLDASAPAHVRYAVRRIRRRFPAAKIVVASWGLCEAEAGSLCELSRSDSCASRLVEAMRFCLDEALAAGAPVREAAAAEGPAQGGERAGPSRPAAPPAQTTGTAAEIAA